MHYKRRKKLGTLPPRIKRESQLVELGYPSGLSPSDWEYNLYKHYRMPAGRYQEMLDEQGGLCAICREKCATGRRLAVDHDHDTGKIRGLLCLNCNHGIGKLGDDPKRIRAAADYLAKHKD